MKLSELNTMQLAGALCKLPPAVSRIMEDPALREAMQSFGKSEERVPAIAYARLAALLAPVLLKEHLNDTADILSALTGKSTGDILAQPGFETIRDIKECLDKDLMDFFMPSADAGRT